MSKFRPSEIPLNDPLRATYLNYDFIIKSYEVYVKKNRAIARFFLTTDVFSMITDLDSQKKGQLFSCFT